MLSLALAAEAESRWRESFALCQRALERSASAPDALNLLGRLFGSRGDAAMAIALQSRVLGLVPGHSGAKRDLAVARRAIRSTEQAEALYAAALAHEPDIAHHHRAFASLLPFVGIDRVEELLRAALELDPSLAPVHAALGNVLSRRCRAAAALSEYGIAVLLDWTFADAHLALAELFAAASDEADAALHRGEALARKTFYATRGPHAVRRVLLVKAPGGFNVSLEFCVDPNRTDLNLYYVTERGPAPQELGEHDVVFNGIADSERFEDAVRRCAELLATLDLPVINDPARLHAVRRSALHATLHGIAGCVAPRTLRVSRAEVARAAAGGETFDGLAYPLLIRPVDTHRGDGMERLGAPEDIPGYLSRFEDERFYVFPFVDYRSPDGLFRKYRVIVVGGRPYPYHLALSHDWLVHYWRVSGLMREHGWMRAEEERFLRDPASAFPGWETTFGEIAGAVGLDYFGVDCAALPDGRVLVFECDPAAFVYCREKIDDVFSYKYDYVPKIFCALDDLLDGKRAAWRS